MKRELKKVLTMLLAAVMIFTAALPNGISAEAAEKTPALKKSSATVAVGGQATVEVKNAGKNAAITFKSANKKIAEVSKDGVVTGLKAGKATINVNVKNGSKTTDLTFSVTVNAPSFYKKQVSLEVGSKKTLKIKNAPKLDEKSVKYTWSSSNKKIATISKKGKITAVNAGFTTIGLKIKTPSKTYKLSKKIYVKSQPTVDITATPGPAGSGEETAPTATPTAESAEVVPEPFYPTNPTQAPTQAPTEAPTEAPTPTPELEDPTDSDGDGTTDIIEKLFGTDPELEDTDGDGIKDSDEIYNLDTDPTKQDTDDDGILDGDEDSDGDGITNKDELANGTDPLLKDTDHDGLNDGDELSVYGTEPNNADTDGDGLSDGDEIILGTDPLKASTDGVTPDGERCFEQELATGAFETTLFAENTMIPSVSGNVPGIIDKNIQIKEYDGITLQDNRAVVGKPLTVETAYDSTKAVTLTFTADSSVMDRFDFMVIASVIDDEIEFVETSVDGNTLSANVGNGTYFVIDAEDLLEGIGIPIRKYKDMVVPAAETEMFEEIVSENIFSGSGDGSTDPKIFGQADIVFVLDTTGSMGDEISNVAKNIETFVDALVNEYSVKANFALIDYKDITCYGEYTQVIKNGYSNWFTDTKTFKDTVNRIYVDGGGDGPETAVDALATAKNLNFRTNANKFAILLTDADNKMDNNYGVSSMEEMAAILKNAGICTSVITDLYYYEDDYECLVKETGGVMANIYGDFASVLLTLAQNIGEIVNDGSWVLLKDYQFVKLGQPLTDSSYSTDSDKLSDWKELGTKKVKDVTPYINWVLRTYDIPADMYRDPKTVTVYDYVSNPILPDTDFDGIDDDKDLQPKINTFTGQVMTYDKKDKAEYDTDKGKISFVMDYRKLFGNLTTFDSELSTMAWIYAADIYENNAAISGDSDTEVYVDGLLTAKHNTPTLMGTFGLKDATRYDIGADNDRTEIVVGHRFVEYNGQKKEVVVVSVRGTNSTFEEWSSNFDVGADTSDYYNIFGSVPEWTNRENHKGFDVTANRVISTVDSYLNSVTLEAGAEKIFLVTGHSRGAGIANIAAATMIDQGRDVVAYLFAPPETTTSSSYNASKYDSIFNVINDDDMIPLLPLEVKWGFHRYGQDFHGSIADASGSKTWFGAGGRYSSGPFNNLVGINYNNNEKLDTMIDKFELVCNDRDSIYRQTYADDTLELQGLDHFTKQGALDDADEYKRKLPVPMQLLGEFVAHEETGLFGVKTWREGIYQTPAYFMQALADLASTTSIHDLASKYEDARNYFVILYASGMAHPHWMQSYYLLSSGTVAVH